MSLATDMQRGGHVTAPAREATLSREVVFKVLSTTKSAGGVLGMMRYVARVREQDREGPAVVFRDGAGDPVPEFEHGDFSRRRKAAKDAWASMELIPDEENLTGRSQHMAPVERARLPLAERLSKRQAFHFVFSARLDHPDQKRAMEEAVAATVRDLFAGEGHMAWQALHDEPVEGGGHAHAHVHVIVKARPDFDGGQPLRFEPDGVRLQEIRQTFADYARLTGLQVEARQREDREEVREAIAEGRERLRPHTSWNRKVGRETNRVGNPLVRTPGWAATQGLEPGRIMPVRKPAPAGTSPDGETVKDIEAVRDDSDGPFGALWRRLRPGKKPGDKKRGSAADLQPVRLPGEDELMRRLSRSFVQPEVARQSWQIMRTEDARLADWYMRNRPEVFGDVYGEAYRRRPRRAPVCRHRDDPFFRDLSSWPKTSDERTLPAPVVTRPVERAGYLLRRRDDLQQKRRDAGMVADCLAVKSGLDGLSLRLRLSGEAGARDLSDRVNAMTDRMLDRAIDTLSAGRRPAGQAAATVLEKVAVKGRPQVPRPERGG